VRANVNEHGAWIYVVWNGPWILQGNEQAIGQVVEHRSFATVDGAAAYLHDKLVKLGEVAESDFEKWIACLSSTRPGAVDCYHSCYPVVWYDPALDDGEFGVGDYAEWEEALRYRKSRENELPKGGKV